LTTIDAQPQIDKPNDYRWLLSAQHFRHLSSAAQRHLLETYVPQMRAARRAANAENAAISTNAQNPNSTIHQNANLTATTNTINAANLPLGSNLRVTNPTMDTLDRTQNETAATGFGDTLVVSFNDSSGLDLRNLSGVAVSTDGGQQWQQSRVPNFGGNNLGDGVVATDLRGTFYYAMIALDRQGQSQIALSRSTNGGKTWKRPVDASTTANGNNSFQDKEWLAVDRTPQSPFKNRVYVTWTSIRNNGTTTIMFAQSRNRGQRFRPAQLIAQSAKMGGFVQGSMVATGPKGEIYISWSDISFENIFGSTNIRFVKSTDGGTTFSDPVTLATVVNPAYPANGIFDGTTFPSLAVDTSAKSTRGNIYLTFPGRGTTPDRADVLLVRSLDAGQTWSPPQVLNDDRSVAEQLLPSIAVANDGTVAATWYDRRNDLANLSLVDVYATVSTDGGQSFAPNRRITTMNWPLVPTPFNLRGGYHGDYHQLGTVADKFLFNWGDDRSGTDADVYLAIHTATSLTTASPDLIARFRTASQTIKPGNTAEYFIDTQLINNNSSAPLTFSASPMLAGIQYQFEPVSNDGQHQQTRLRVITTSDLPPNAYFLTVKVQQGELTRSTATRLSVLTADRLAQLPRNITANRSSSLFPSASIDRTGNINVAWLDDQAGLISIFFTRSTDAGQTFASPVMLRRNQSFIGTPQVMANEREIYIAFLEFFDQPEVRLQTMLTRSTDGGQTFSPAQPVLTNRQLFVTTETFQLDSDGTLHFGVMTLNPPDSTNPIFTNFDLRSRDQGQSFQLQPIFASPSSLSPPVIAVEGDGRTIRSTFIDFNRTNGGLLFTRSTDGGSTYAPPTKVLSRVDRLLFAGAFFGENQQTHIVFAEGSLQEEVFELFYTRSQTNDQFASPSPVMTEAQTILSGSLGADAQGNVVIAFEGSFNRFNDPDFLSQVFYTNSIDNGQTFAPTRTFTPQRGGDFLPVVILDLQGDFALLWDGFNRDALDIFYTRSANKGRDFPPPVNLTQSAGTSTYSAFAFDIDGRLDLFFQDNSGGSFDIFRTKLAPPLTSPDLISPQ
jgi:hypothetical protein